MIKGVLSTCPGIVVGTTISFLSRENDDIDEQEPSVRTLTPTKKNHTKLGPNECKSAELARDERKRLDTLEE